MRIAAIVTLASALALAACNSSPEKLPEDLNTAETGNVAVVPENAVEVPGPVNATNVAAPKAEPAPAFTDQQQMKDDADATGMTARLPDDDAGPAQKANETRPAE